MPKTITKKEKEETSEKVPVNILWKNILMLPITGTIDSKRAQDIMEAALIKIEETQSKVLILDILGVAVVDSAVANHLVKITKAAKLMGCQAVLTGISPAISQTLVHLGVELGDVTSRATIADGLEVAFDHLGLEVRAVRSGQQK